MALSAAAVMDAFWGRVWNERDPVAAEELIAPDFVLHVAGAELTGRDLMASGTLVEQWFEPFPDLRVEVLVRVVQGEWVAEVVEFTGTHTGTACRPGLFRARGLPAIPASGAPFAFTQTSLTRVVDGRLVEVWEDFDRVRLWLALGVTIEVPTAGG